jgi:hypothetical protein
MIWYAWIPFMVENKGVLDLCWIRNVDYSNAVVIIATIEWHIPWLEADSVAIMQFWIERGAQNQTRGDKRKFGHFAIRFLIPLFAGEVVSSANFTFNQEAVLRVLEDSKDTKAA